MNTFQRLLKQFTAVKEHHEKRWSDLRAESDEQFNLMTLAERSLQFVRADMCEVCKGSGKLLDISSLDGTDVICPKCGGEGLLS